MTTRHQVGGWRLVGVLRTDRTTRIGLGRAYINITRKAAR